MSKIKENLRKVFQYIDTHQDRMVDDLREIVSIPSVSGSLKHHKEIQTMSKWIEKWLKKLRPQMVERFDIGSYSLDGKVIKLPTIILAKFGQDQKKKTICVYCRYDVKNVNNNNKKWDHDVDPWTVTETGGQLYGRGTCKGKMPLISWFHCIEAFLMQKIPLPVNIKFIIEGMYEMNCFGLEEFLYTQRITFCKNIDFICVNESEWLNSKIPCISYGTCGLCQYELMVVTNKKKHSLSMDSEKILDYICENCVDNLGNILISNINDDVVQISPEIEQSLESVVCDLSMVKKNLPKYMELWGKQKILLRLWQMPSLIMADSIPLKCNCCSGGDYDGGGDDVNSPVDCKEVNGFSRKFILKIVPVQTPKRCTEFIMNHIKKLIEQKFNQNLTEKFIFSHVIDKDGRKLISRIMCTKTKIEDTTNKKDISSNNIEEIGRITCSSISETRAWQENSASLHYEAAKRATGHVFKDSPSLIKDSNDSTVILILKKLIQKSTILLPLCDNKMDDQFDNECIRRLAYFEAKKLLASYISEVGSI